MNEEKIMTLHPQGKKGVNIQRILMPFSRTPYINTPNQIASLSLAMTTLE
ncbi:hypothetical protein [Cyclobacterium roseum]|nr:hypothetical protein [Cyclobacterium roseum]